jgi:hypothetical protein
MCERTAQLPRRQRAATGAPTESYAELRCRAGQQLSGTCLARTGSRRACACVRACVRACVVPQIRGVPPVEMGHPHQVPPHTQIDQRVEMPRGATTIVTFQESQAHPCELSLPLLPATEAKAPENQRHLRLRAQATYRSAACLSFVEWQH